jgi:citrate (Re)-synthase
MQPIMTAVENGIRPRVHMEDTTRADIHGWVIPFMLRVLRETEGQAKFRVCDTIGMGSPDPYAALPMGIPRLTTTLIAETGAELEFHGHNDFGLATANTLAFWRYGGTKANTAFGGLGERSGNTSLEQVLANYIRLYGDPGFDLTALAEIADLINGEVRALPSNAPIVGEVFTSQAGLHQTGLERQGAAEGGYIYLAFNPNVVGREDTELHRLGHVSGIDGIVSILNRESEKRTGQPGAYAAVSRAVKYVYDKVHAAYDGQLDPKTGRYADYRMTFFTADEIYELAQEYERGHGRG